MLIEFNKPTAWPVAPIIKDLKEYWASGGIENKNIPGVAAVQ
jgi:hypothetical protein